MVLFVVCGLVAPRHLISELLAFWQLSGHTLQGHGGHQTRQEQGNAGSYSLVMVLNNSRNLGPAFMV